MASAVRRASVFILAEASSLPRDFVTDTPLIGRQWLQDMEVRTKYLSRLARTWVESDDLVGIGDEEKEKERQKRR